MIDFSRQMRESTAYQKYKQIFEEAMREYESTCVDFYRRDDMARKQYRENIKKRIHFDVPPTTISGEDEEKTQKEGQEPNLGIEKEDE